MKWSKTSILRSMKCSLYSKDTKRPCWKRCLKLQGQQLWVIALCYWWFSEHRFTCAVYCFVVYSVVLQGTCLHGIVVLQGPVYASILLFCRAHIYMCILLFCKVHVYACILLFCSTCLRVAGQYLCILLFCGAFCFAGYNNLFSMFMCVFRCCRAHAYMCIYFSGHTFTHVFCCFAWHKFTHVFHCFAGHMFTCVVSRSEYTWTMPWKTGHM